MRVLWVEDSARLQRTGSTWLRRSGFAVDVSGDGEEGLWLAETNEVGLPAVLETPAKKPGNKPTRIERRGLIVASRFN